MKLLDVGGATGKSRARMKKFIARQRIFTAGKDVLGYEVLFRAGANQVPITKCPVN